jgi:hypothetical protein
LFPAFLIGFLPLLQSETLLLNWRTHLPTNQLGLLRRIQDTQLKTKMITKTVIEQKLLVMYK